MTVSFVSSGAVAYSAASGSSVAVPYPSTNTADTMMIMVVGQKGSSANVGTVSTPSGWTLVFRRTNTGSENTGGYSTTYGSGTGNTNLYVFKKISAAETGTLSVTLAANNMAWGQMVNYSKTLGNWRIAASISADVTTGTAVSLTGFYNTGISSGDQVFGCMVVPQSGGTFSGQSFTSSGATLAGATEIAEASSALGNQIGGFTARTNCTAGTGNSRPVLTATAAGTTSNIRGPGCIIRIAEFDTAASSVLVSRQDFSGSDGSAWPVFVAGVADPTGGSGTIQSGWGRLVTGSAGGYAGMTSRRLSTQYEDIVHHFKVRFPSAVEIYPQLHIRAVGNGIDGNGGTYLEMTRNTNMWSVVSTGSYANGTTYDGATASHTWTIGQAYNVIFGSVGNDLRFKVWAEGTEEPSAYTYSADWSLLSGVGYTGFRAGPGAAGSLQVEFDDYAAFNAFPEVVTSDLDLQYVVEPNTTPVDSDLDLRYAVRASINSDSDIRWAVRAVLLSSVDLRWISRVRLTSDSDLRWLTRNAVPSSDLDIRWVSRAQVQSSVDLRWVSRIRLTSDSDLRWAVRAVILSQSDLRWVSRAQAQSDLDLRWVSRIRLNSDADLRWLSKAQAQSDLDIRWVSRAQAQSDVDLRWITDSSVLSLSVDADLRWAVRARLDSDLSVPFAVRSVALSDADFRWAVRMPTASDLSLLWAVDDVATVLSDLDVRWTVRLRLSSDLSLRWVVVSLSPPATGGVAWTGSPAGPMAQAGSGSAPMAQGSDGAQFHPVTTEG